MIDNNFNKSQYQQFGDIYLKEQVRKGGVGGGKPHDRVALLKKISPPWKWHDANREFATLK